MNLVADSLEHRHVALAHLAAVQAALANSVGYVHRQEKWLVQLLRCDFDPDFFILLIQGEEALHFVGTVDQVFERPDRAWIETCDDSVSRGGCDRRGNHLRGCSGRRGVLGSGVGNGTVAQHEKQTGSDRFQDRHDSPSFGGASLIRGAASIQFDL